MRDFRSRAILWTLIAVYAFVLPEAIILYRAIVDRFGQEAAGKIPLILVIGTGIAYAAAVALSRRRWENVLFLLPAAMFAVLIISLEPNPNKHIHIPEYVLAAWLLYAVLSRDYKGRGLLLLVLVSAMLLGVVDELEQGIRPKRFYGWSDMLVNSASALIGVFTIMGLRPPLPGDWSWTKRLRQHRPFVLLALFGFVGILITCVCLFRVQAALRTVGVYPAWLAVWNALYLIAAPIVAREVLAPPRNVSPPRRQPDPPPDDDDVTARLWLAPLLVILFYMHALAVLVVGSGVVFE
jgi:hypothetical protein